MNDRLSAMLLILRRRRRRKALSKINLAVDLLLLDLATRPGRGHMRLATLPRTPFYFNLNESHEEYIMRIINHPIKLQECTGMLPEEYEALFVPFEAELMRHGIRGDNFRATKYSPKSRLFNVLTFLHANYTCRFGELFTKWSKSSLNRDLHHCCAVLHTVVSTMCQMPFPTAEEQNELLSITPEPLRSLGVFLFIDGTKIKSVNTIHPDAAAIDYNKYGGMGINVQIATDILGRPRYLNVGFGGRRHDSQIYQDTELFWQFDEFEWDNDKTVGSDCGYSGKSNYKTGSKNIVKPYTMAQIRAMPAEQQDLAHTFNRVLRSRRLCNEQVMRVAKRLAFTGNGSISRLSLFRNRESQIRLVETAVLLQFTLMQMRGQVCQSNPAVVQAGIAGVNMAERVVNYYTRGSLFTKPGNERAFFGERLAGENVLPPHPLLNNV